MQPEMYYVIGWLVLAVVLAIAEAATVGLVAIWFAIGALVAMIPAYLGAPLWGQFLVFLVISAICFAFTRRFFKDVLKFKKQSTNADSLIGKECLVTADIDNIKGGGKVDISGLTWSARTSDGSEAAVGALVVVQRIEGATLIVLPKA